MNILYSETLIRTLSIFKEINMNFAKAEATSIPVSYLFILYLTRFGLGFGNRIFSLCCVLFESGFKIFASTIFTEWFIN